jgi:hypothetical protein
MSTTPLNLDDVFISTGTKYGIDPSFLKAIAKTENGQFSLNPVSRRGTQGFMQITHDTWPLYSADPYNKNPSAQIEVAGRIFNDLSSRYNGNTTLMAVAFNAGPATADGIKADMAIGYSYDDAVRDVVPRYSSDPKKVQEVMNYPKNVSKNGGGIMPGLPINSNGTQDNSPPIPFGVDNTNPEEAVQFTGKAVPDAVLQNLTPVTVITGGLDNKAWFNDLSSGGMVVGNLPLKSAFNPQPVSFQIKFLDGKNLVDSNNKPITLLLNASLKRYEISYAHIVNKSPSRTGFHVTFWGQQADVITGSASTGVFMNQLGLTSFMSMSKITPEVTDLVNSAFSTGGTFRAGDNSTAPSQALSSGGLRVAAQDAFVELLSLFKMNGVVYFKNQDHDVGGKASSFQQSSPSAFSPTTGSSTAQMNARHNDVMTRGSVIFNFKNNVYTGFFKSLSWVMDAQKPYSWDFNFVFQVERTYSSVYYPFTSSGQVGDGSTGSNSGQIPAPHDDN